MRKIKQGKCDYDYVELMACPSGCLNGGGQVKLAKVNTSRAAKGEPQLSNKELIENVEKYLNTIEKRTITDPSNEEENK